METDKHTKKDRERERELKREYWNLQILWGSPVSLNITYLGLNKFETVFTVFIIFLIYVNIIFQY